MQDEISALDTALDHPRRPVGAVVGGAKISTKLALLGNIVEKVELLILGGGMANTFLAARGVNVGKSLCEHHMFAQVDAIEKRAIAAGCEITCCRLTPWSPAHSRPTPPARHCRWPTFRRTA